MSGRGRGRRRGGGRGGFYRGSKNSGYTKPKKTLADYVYYLGSAKQKADYETTIAYLINQIQKTFPYGKDISSALDDLKPYDLSKHKPIKQVSKSTDKDIAFEENDQFKMEFKSDYDSFNKRKQTLEFNMSKAYSFLWDQCAQGMQTKIEENSRFDTEIKGDPIELLKTIKSYALNYHEHRYEMAIIFESLRLMINLKQKEGESLIDYTKRFKTAQDVMVSHIGGPLQLTNL
jgi:hypothetical protein